MATIVPISHSAATLCSLTKEFNMNYLKDLLSLSNVDGFSTLSDKKQRCVVHWIQDLGLVIGEEASPLWDLLLQWHFAKLISGEVSWALEYLLKYLHPDTLLFLLKTHSPQLSSVQRVKAANEVIGRGNYRVHYRQLTDHSSYFMEMLAEELTLEERQRTEIKDRVIELGIVGNILPMVWLDESPLTLNPVFQLNSEQYIKAVDRLIEISCRDTLVSCWDQSNIRLTDEQCIVLKRRVTGEVVSCLSWCNYSCFGQLTDEHIRMSVERAFLERRVGQFLSEQLKQMVDNAGTRRRYI